MARLSLCWFKLYICNQYLKRKKKRSRGSCMQYLNLITFLNKLEQLCVTMHWGLRCVHCQSNIPFKWSQREINKIHFNRGLLFIYVAYCHLLHYAFHSQEQQLFHVSECKVKFWLEAKAVSDQKGNYFSYEWIPYQDQLMQWCLN